MSPDREGPRKTVKDTRSSTTATQMADEGQGKPIDIRPTETGD